MISKELLSVVLEKHPRIEITDIEVKKNSLCWIDAEIPKSVYDETRSINIYELAHKCKEWANDKGYTLESTEKWCNYYRGNINEVNIDDGYIDYTIADTEPEAIFKACQWILENEDNIKAEESIEVASKHKKHKLSTKIIESIKTINIK